MNLSLIAGYTAVNFLKIVHVHTDSDPGYVWKKKKLLLQNK